MTVSTETATHPSASWTWRGQTVHYIQQGTQGHTLLLIHGFGASTRHWRKNISVLAQHHQVYAVDLLGFGESAKPNWEYRTEVWRDQLRDFCQQVIRRPVVAIGNSLGGYVALSLAVDLPEWTRGVVLLNGAGSFSSASSQSPSIQQLMRPVLRWGLNQKVIAYLLFHYLRQPHVIREKLKQVYYDPEMVTDQLVEDIYRPSCDPGAADVFAALLRGGQRGRSLDELLRSLVRPLLLIWGEKDPWISARQRSDLFHQHYHQITEHFLPAGHCPHDERPAEVNRLLLEWLGEVLQPPIRLEETTIAELGSS